MLLKLLILGKLNMQLSQLISTICVISPKTQPSNIKYLSALLIMFLGLTNLSVNAQEANSSFIENTDFSRVVKAHSQNKTDLDQLESISNIEIFYWYGCESCYQVELALQQYLDLHPEITLRRTPLIARPSWRLQANLQAIMEQLTDPTISLPPSKLYQACLQDCQVFNAFENNKAWLSQSLQLTEFPVLDLSRLWNTEKNYQKRADLFSITQVPTIIINETFKIEANQAKTPARMVKIADYLLSSVPQ